LKNNLRYWDTTCFLGWLKNEPDKVDECRGIIQACENDKLKIVTSTLTLAEVLYLRPNAKIPKEESETIRAFFDHSYIITVPLDRMIAEKAQDLIWEYGIKSKDAVHAASAIFSRVKILDTFDPDFNVMDNKIGTPPLQIGRPCFPYQFELDEKKDKAK